MTFFPSNRHRDRIDLKFIKIEEHLLSIIIKENYKTFNGEQLPATEDMIESINRILAALEPNLICKIDMMYYLGKLDVISQYSTLKTIDIFKLIKDLQPINNYISALPEVHFCANVKDAINQINDLVYVNGQVVKLIYDIENLLDVKDIEKIRARMSSVRLAMLGRRPFQFKHQKVLLAKLRKAIQSPTENAKLLTEIYVHLRKLKYETKLLSLQRWVTDIRSDDVNIEIIKFLSALKNAENHRIDWWHLTWQMPVNTEAIKLMENMKGKPVTYNRERLSHFLEPLIQRARESHKLDENDHKESIKSINGDSIWADLTTVDKLNIVPGVESNKEAVRKLRAKIQEELNMMTAYGR